MFDKITEFIRQPFFDEIEEENEEGAIEVFYLPKRTPIKKFIGELLSCYWCTGVWVSAAVVAGYPFLSDYNFSNHACVCSCRISSNLRIHCSAMVINKKIA